MGETAATIDHDAPDPYVSKAGSGGWRGVKEDLLPLMALLGAVYGWVLALIVVLIGAVVLAVR